MFMVKTNARSTNFDACLCVSATEVLLIGLQSSNTTLWSSNFIQLIKDEYLKNVDAGLYTTNVQSLEFATAFVSSVISDTE